MAEIKTKDGIFIGLITEENEKLLFPERNIIPEEEPKEEKPVAKKKATKKPKE